MWYLQHQKSTHLVDMNNLTKRNEKKTSIETNDGLSGTYLYCQLGLNPSGLYQSIQ